VRFLLGKKADLIIPIIYSQIGRDKNNKIESSGNSTSEMRPHLDLLTSGEYSSMQDKKALPFQLSPVEHDGG